MTIRYDDGTTAEFEVPGGKADPNLRMPQAALQVRWVGQDGQDWTGPGPGVGPDGLQDVHLALAKLSPKVEIQAVAVDGPGGVAWQFGLNPKGLPNAELVRRPGDPTQADLFFNPDRDLSRQDPDRDGRLRQRQDRHGHGGRGPDRPDAAPCPRPPRSGSSRTAIAARWLGQDGRPAPAPATCTSPLTGLPRRPDASSPPR